MTFGEKLQELRRKGAMSQDVLAEKLEVSRQAVSKWERDEAIPETDKLVRIAQLFGVSTDYLLLDRNREQTEQTRNPDPGGDFSAVGRRLERFIRRHGYKYGYVLIGIGSLFCILSLLVMLLMPGFGDELFAVGSAPVWNSEIQMGGDISQDVINQLQGSMGGVPGGNNWGGLFGNLEQGYQSGVNQMQEVWRKSTGTVAVMFGIPTMLLGIVLIVLGTVIVVKGKKIAVRV